MYCNVCEHLTRTEEDYFCCIYHNIMMIGFDMKSLMDECPLDDG